MTRIMFTSCTEFLNSLFQPWNQQSMSFHYDTISIYGAMIYNFACIKEKVKKTKQLQSVSFIPRQHPETNGKTKNQCNPHYHSLHDHWQISKVEFWVKKSLLIFRTKITYSIISIIEATLFVYLQYELQGNTIPKHFIYYFSC